MSIQGEIERISANVASAYDAVQERGGNLPEHANSANLAAAIQSIPAGESGDTYLIKAPVGTIVIWSGNVDNIPAGWHLCDGTGGTPDLRDKFVLGSGKTHSVGDEGGVEEVALTVANMPEHTHQYSRVTWSGSVAVASNGNNIVRTEITHFTGNTYTTGENEPHENMPPYYTLCYIMKLTADETDTGGNGNCTADKVVFNPETTDLTADNIQQAIEELFKMYKTLQQRGTGIYGVRWDGSSTTKLQRTYDSAFFEDPEPAVGTENGSSPFDDIYPWSEMKQVTDGENVLVAIPKYYIKVQHNPFRVQISGTYKEGFQVSPAHQDRGDGLGERDVVYIGRYECDSSYMSRSGQSPKVSTSIGAFRSGISAIGDEYWQADFALQLTWWFLYIVEFADWNAQTAIGQGVVSASTTINTGATDSMAYHTGRAAGTDGRTAVQYRNIENPWGNVREWRDGIIFSDENICTYNKPADFKDTYNGTGATLQSNKRPTTSKGYIKAWGYDEDDPSFIYPSEVGGSETTFVPDECYYFSGVRGLYVSGSYSSGTSAGPFYLNNFPPTGTIESLGSRLQKLPGKKSGGSNFDGAPE